MAEIFVRVHSPLFFQNFPSTFLQVSLSIQFTTFKSLFTLNVQIQVTLPVLNCNLFMLSVQFLFTLSLSNCILNTFGVQVSVILSLLNCDLVTLGVQILVTAPVFMNGDSFLYVSPSILYRSFEQLGRTTHDWTCYS